MADNVTNPATVTIATKDRSGVHVQRHVIEDGTPASTEYVKASTANGLYTDVRNVAQCASRSVVAVALNTSSVSLKAANAARRGLMIYNGGSQTLYVIYGATASLSLYSFPIAPGGFFEMNPFQIDPGQVSGIWAAAGTGSALVTEQT